MSELSQLVKDDLRYVWHPASQMQEYLNNFPPKAIVRGKGVYLECEDGSKILDIISSWWCNLLGHCNEEISASLKQQLDTLEHVIFANFTHPGAVQLCQELVKLLPNGLEHFNFADNGSSGVEMALKMAFQYQLQTGNPHRVRFACLSDGYHGETIGALSVGSMDLYAQIYKPMLMKNLQLQAPDCFRCPYGQKRDSCSCPCLEQARQFFEQYADTLAALIVEPLLQGAAGMRIYPVAYLKGLRELCTQYEVLLIADEIATGFGRTGAYFACLKASISPDLMILSKALTGGYMPMSLVATTTQVYEAFLGQLHEHKGFVHSHTYAGNPLGCACALSVIRILQRDAILNKAAQTASWLKHRLKSEFASYDNIGEIRSIGLINAFELVEQRSTKKAFAAQCTVGYKLYRQALENGLLLRNIGDVFYFNPALNIGIEDLDKAIVLLKKSLDQVLCTL